MNTIAIVCHKVCFFLEISTSRTQQRKLIRLHIQCQHPRSPKLFCLFIASKLFTFMVLVNIEVKH